MTKDIKVMFDKKDDLIINILKLKDNIVDTKTDMEEYRVLSNNIKASIFFNKEDDGSLDKEISRLTESIKRRENLLSNENYVNKAPKNIVDMDIQKLKEEKEKLDELLKKV